jgi:dipeptidyl aminopeptidase/acylaminoacyl peptidase
MRQICAVMLLAVFCFAGVPATARAFGIADVLAAPFPDALVASPDGTVLVWKVDASGIRNLYTNAGGTIHALTHYNDDDGQDVFSPAVTPGNDAVVYWHGNAGDEGDGANANPLSKVPPAQRTLYIVPIAGGDSVKLADGANGFELSPKGDIVAFNTSEGQIGFINITKDADGAFKGGDPFMLPIRGSVSDAVWSPDGSKIAFTNHRGDHAFIVIYTPAKKSYVYATPDFTNDAFPAWSPDSSRVAFVRSPGQKWGETLYDLDNFDGGDTSFPFQIWVANANSGNARRIWSAKPGMGASFFPMINPAPNPSQLFWLKGDYVAFPYEGSGWSHIYAVSANGGAAKDLTPGRYEVEAAETNLDQTKVLLATNQGDLDARHIWSVGLVGRTKQLTFGPQNQWYPTALAHDGLAYISAGYAAPPQVTIAGNPPKQLVAVAAPANYPAAQMVKPQLITYTTPDGYTIHAQYFQPRHFTGKLPAIVFDHGGPPRQMLGGFHYMEPYTHLYEMNQYLVSKGFAVLSINYRLGIMYGNKFRNPPHGAWHGGSEYNDVLAGGKWLQRQPQIDPNRIGIYGLSYGGLLTALALAKNSDIFKVGADFAGVHDWTSTFDHDYGRPIGTPEQRKIATASTAECCLKQWKSPVLIEQGDDDRNVPFSQSVDLATKLRAQGVTVETQVFTNETHENSVWSNLVIQYRTAEAFLARYLHPSP